MDLEHTQMCQGRTSTLVAFYYIRHRQNKTIFPVNNSEIDCLLFLIKYLINIFYSLYCWFSNFHWCLFSFLIKLYLMPFAPLLCYFEAVSFYQWMKEKPPTLIGNTDNPIQLWLKSSTPDDIYIEKRWRTTEFLEQLRHVFV